MDDSPVHHRLCNHGCKNGLPWEGGSQGQGSRQDNTLSFSFIDPSGFKTCSQRWFWDFHYSAEIAVDWRYIIKIMYIEFRLVPWGKGCRLGPWPGNILHGLDRDPSVTVLSIFNTELPSHVQFSFLELVVPAPGDSPAVTQPSLSAWLPPPPLDCWDTVQGC